MLEHRHIDKAELSRFLSLQEGHFLDLKRIEITPAKLSESISAFANTSGGELFIGIGENDGKAVRFWNGFPSMEAANGLFQVIDKMTPLANHYAATWYSADAQPGFLLYLMISKTRALVNATDGYAYRRFNAQNIKVSSVDDINRLRLDKGIVTFEEGIIPLT